MHGNKSRPVNGSVLPEHNHTGQSMFDVMNPESRDKRRCASEMASQSRFTRSSQAIGTAENIFGGETVADPSTKLAPDKNFRRASEASGRLWARENEFEMFEDKQLSKH